MAKAPTTPPVVVLDTNLVLSALVFAGGRLAPLRTAWQSGRIVPLVSMATASELMRVLGYPKFKLSADDLDELLADYLPHCRSVRLPARMPKLPRCRDVNDLLAQPFVHFRDRAMDGGNLQSRTTTRQASGLHP